jgi:predicted dithiol-disulfide oxidoreductase (DUF899 family)
LVEDKALTRARDAMAAKRRRMPWMAVEKDYRFDGPHGPASLLDMFEGRRQLIVYRFLQALYGWETIPWYGLTDDFDADFDVSEWPGTNAFYRDDDDRIFRTYFVNSRGDEAMGGTWAYLDITALGRQEEWEDSPEGYPQTPPYQWWHQHDQYPKA